MYEIINNLLLILVRISLCNSKMSSPNNSSESSLSILTNHKIRVNENFVTKLTKDNNSLKKQVNKSSKVIYFPKGWNFKKILSTLDGLNPKKYPNLFIFIIKNLNLVDDQNKIDKLIKSLLKFSDARPVILQLTSNCETKFYYKDEALVEMKIVGITDENFEINKNFSSFLSAFLTGRIHIFEDQMISTILGAENCSLILRFLRTLNLNQNIVKKIILKASKNGRKDEFKQLWKPRLMIMEGC